MSIAQCMEKKPLSGPPPQLRFFRMRDQSPRLQGSEEAPRPPWEAQHRPPILTLNFHLRGSCEVLWTLPRTALSRGDRRGQDFQAEVLLPLLTWAQGQRKWKSLLTSKVRVREGGGRFDPLPASLSVKGGTLVTSVSRSYAGPLTALCHRNLITPTGVLITVLCFCFS